MLDATWPEPDAGLIERRSNWLAQLPGAERLQHRAGSTGSAEGRSLARLVCDVAGALPEDTLYCLDAGQVRRQAVQHLVARKRRTVLSAESLAPMGWGIGVGIRAKLAARERTVVVFTGDGSMLMVAANRCVASGQPISSRRGGATPNARLARVGEGRSIYSSRRHVTAAFSRSSSMAASRVVPRHAVTSATMRWQTA